MTRLLAIILLLCSFNAHALYYCKCDTGAHASCTAGSDANDGSTAALARSTLFSESTFNSAAAGSQFLLCRGGYWNGETDRNLSNMNSTAANPVRIDSYAPSSGATGTPIIAATTNTSLFTFGGFNNADDDKGYYIGDIWLQGPGGSSTQAGLQTNGLLSFITLNGTRMEGFYLGMYFVSGSTVNYARLANVTIARNHGMGLLGSANDWLIEDSLFEENNFSGSGLNHAIYAGGTTARSRVTVRRTTFRNNSTVSGVCNGGNLTVHGVMDQVLFQYNRIEVPSASSTCYGISIKEGYSIAERVGRTVIDGNTLVNLGGNSILAALTPDVWITNNKIINDTTTGFTSGISIENPQASDDLAIAAAGNAFVGYNTCYYKSASSGQCIWIANGTNHRVVGNIAYIGAGSGANCWQHTSLSNFAQWDRNQCYRLGSGSWSSSYGNLAAAQAAGFDTNGSSADPLFVAVPTALNSWSLALQSGSSARGAGDATRKPVRDALGCVRNVSPPDRGAEQYGATPCLSGTGTVQWFR